MLEGNPHSALVIVDGAAGARHRAMNRDDVMLWFAAGERSGRESVYQCIGIGPETVESWRFDMQNRRHRALRLWRALTGKQFGEALALFQSIVDEIIQDQEVYSALAEIDKLRRFGRENKEHRLLSEALSRIGSGLALENLNFAGFLAIGGIYLFLGADKEEIHSLMAAFYAGISQIGGNAEREDEQLISLLLRSGNLMKQTDFREEKGIESSNKATEERITTALETRRQLAERIAKAAAHNQRQIGFGLIAPDNSNFLKHYDNAMQTLGAGDKPVTEQAFGAFLAHTRNALTALVNDVQNLELPEETQQILIRLKQLFTGRQIDERLYQRIAGGYEDIGDFGRLAQAMRERAEQGNIDSHAKHTGLMSIAKGAELFYIMLAIDSTIGLIRDDTQSCDDLSIWRALAGFFAKTINDHSYEYRPWIYSRGNGYRDYHGESLYQLAVERHKWLYAYLRFIVARYTELRAMPELEQDLLLGNFLHPNKVAAIGADAEGGAEKIWRAYGQLRELAFIRNDGFRLPDVFADFDPELIKHRFRVNHVFAVPVGRTHFSALCAKALTLARELEQAGRRGANLIITRNIGVVEKSGYAKPVVQIDSGHLYIDAKTYTNALVSHKNYIREEAERICASLLHPKGIRIAARFRHPILAALVYPFHGNPVYDSGNLEACGLPYTVQSLFHTWTTYDKTKYRAIFSASGVELPDEIAWQTEDSARHPEKAITKNRILHGLPDSRYPGLIEFSRRHPLVMIKDAAESGAQCPGLLIAPSGQIARSGTIGIGGRVYLPNLFTAPGLYSGGYPEFAGILGDRRVYARFRSQADCRMGQRSQSPKASIHQPIRLTPHNSLHG